MKTVKLFDQNARQDSTVQPSAVRDDTPARQFHARLVMTDGRRYCALTGEGAIWVVPAAGCLLQPAVGDIALVSVSGPDGYVLAILERAQPDSEAVVSMQGALRVEAGKVDIVARQGVDIDAGTQLTLRATDGRMHYETLNMEGARLHARWTQRVEVTQQRIDISKRSETHFGHSTRRIATHEEVTATSYRQIVSRDWSVRAGTARLVADDRVVIDGNAVQIG
ncbi:MAG TPA: DUF3540 domain-containing protein [Burkholderiaceae bacterium]|nr:DUF3540 domain-containing protein [Burkholderiaceae bacterium]